MPINSKNKLQIKESKIAGNGMFATQNISSGEVIYRLSGEPCTLDEILKKIKEGKESASDPLQIGDELYLDLDELSKTFNHSCDPNSFIKNMNDLVALKNIKQGDEITFDYSTTMDDYEEKILKTGRKPWAGECNCKSNNCRKLIDQFKRIPKEVQNFYIENKLMPDFMLKKFAPKASH